MNIWVNMVNFIDRWITKLASELVLADYEQNHPEKLRGLQEQVSTCGYPQPRSEDDRIFWDVYRNTYGRGGSGKSNGC